MSKADRSPALAPISRLHCAAPVPLHNKYQLLDVSETILPEVPTGPEGRRHAWPSAFVLIMFCLTLVGRFVQMARDTVAMHCHKRKSTIAKSGKPRMPSDMKKCKPPTSDKPSQPPSAARRRPGGIQDQFGLRGRALRVCGQRISRVSRRQSKQLKTRREHRTRHLCRSEAKTCKLKDVMIKHLAAQAREEVTHMKMQINDSQSRRQASHRQSVAAAKHCKPQGPTVHALLPVIV